MARQDTVEGAGFYGAEADMWSVGVVAYVVLSGAPAFESSRLEEAIAAGRFTPMTGRRWTKV